MSNDAPTTDYVKIISDRLDDIGKLSATPKLIKDQAISALQFVMNENLTNSAKKTINNRISQLNNLSDDSITSNFKIIYSQMCILAVSDLEATLKLYFANALNNTTNINLASKRLKEIKVSIREIISNDLKFGGKLGNLIIEKEKLNFQDLGAIKWNFKEYLNKELVLEDKHEKKICYYLEARHVLVHRGGLVDKKFINSVNAIGANLKNLKIGSEITINNDDWLDMRVSFIDLIAKATMKRVRSEN